MSPAHPELTTTTLAIHNNSEHAHDGIPLGGPECTCLHLAQRILTTRENPRTGSTRIAISEYLEAVAA